MNARQRKFAHEYVRNGFCGVLAVQLAGYQQGYNAACVTASRLLRKAKVQKLVEDNLKAAKMSADEVLETLTDVARTETEIKGSDRIKALELLGKGHKLFVDKVESTDLTLQSASESALLKSIESAAKRDNIEDSDAAIQLYQALSDDPQFSDLASWPAQYRPAIQAQLQATEHVIDVSGEQ